MVVAAASVVFTIRYQDEIVSLFIREANKQIQTPVDVKQVNFSLFRQFPDVTISLRDVVVDESYGGSDSKLLRAESVRFTFSLWDIIHKRYQVRNIQVEKADLFIRYNSEGEPNFRILSKRENSKGTFFSLENIRLKDVNVHYEHATSEVMIDLYTPLSRARIKGQAGQLAFDLTGKLLTEHVKVQDKFYFREKHISYDTRIIYQSGTKATTIENGELTIDNAPFTVVGDVKSAEKTLNLKITGRNTTFNSLLSLLPSDYAKPYKQYKSRGKVFFVAAVDGHYDLAHGLNVDVSFGSNNASFYHPGFKKGFEEVHFNGRFLNGADNRARTFELRIDGFSCKLDDRPVAGNLLVRNFDDYYLKFDLKGLVDVHTLLDIFPNKQIRSAYGRVNVDLHGTGRLSDLNNPKRRSRFNADGEIELQNLSFILNGERLPFNSFNGSFMFNKNDLAISNFTGKIGSSDFKLNGFFKRITSWLFSRNQKISIEADLHSEFLDFDELLKSNFASRDTTNRKDKLYNFRISPDLQLKFNCLVSRVKFRRFTGRDIRGDMSINNRIATFDHIRLHSIGGLAVLSGSVSNKDDNRVELIADAEIEGIAIDSIFYVFNNFNQNWIVDRNLRGRITANVNTYLRFNRFLELDTRSMIADIHATVDEGELIDFEPAQHLSTFIDEETLSHLKFSKMQNDIRIADRTVYIPEMDIHTNISDISISGSHTFDQQIDYHISVPLMLLLNSGKKKRFAEDAIDGGNLLLKISGTASDYKVAYDTKAFVNEIGSEITNEGAEWKEILKNKGVKEPDQKAEPALEEEEYFDFDEDDDKDGGGRY